MANLTRSILFLNNHETPATFEFIAQASGMFCGARSAIALLDRLPAAALEISALDEGVSVIAGDVTLRVRGPYAAFGGRENEIAALLAMQSGWATAAQRLVQAARPLPVVSATEKAVPAALAEWLEHAIEVGGIQPLSSALSGGFVPRSLVLFMGDTVRAAQAFDQTADAALPRIAPVDLFHDDADEAVRVALALGDKLTGVEIECSAERLSADLLTRVRAQLDLGGFPRVKIFVGGDISVERIEGWLQEQAPLDGFYVGGTIAFAPPLPVSAELKEWNGKPFARRGIAPGTTPSPRLKVVSR